MLDLILHRKCFSLIDFVLIEINDIIEDVIIILILAFIFVTPSRFILFWQSTLFFRDI